MLARTPMIAAGGGIGSVHTDEMIAEGLVTLGQVYLIKHRADSPVRALSASDGFLWRP